MSDSALSFQTAIYSLLNGDATLATLINGVFDYVKEGAVLPYIRMGDDVFRDWNTMDFFGKQVMSTIHTFARGEGKLTIKTIMGNVFRILNNASLTVSGAATCVFLQQEFETVIVESDNVTYHGVQRFRALIQE